LPREKAARQLASTCNGFQPPSTPEANGLYRFYLPLIADSSVDDFVLVKSETIATRAICRPRAITPSGALLSRGVSIKGSVKFLNELLIDGEVEGNIFVTERCELQAGCTLRGNIEAPRLMVEENARFLGAPSPDAFMTACQEWPGGRSLSSEMVCEQGRMTQDSGRTAPPRWLCWEGQREGPAVSGLPSVSACWANPPSTPSLLDEGGHRGAVPQCHSGRPLHERSRDRERGCDSGGHPD
jgi:bactofilin